jgi:hypothetical protein
VILVDVSLPVQEDEPCAVEMRERAHDSGRRLPGAQGPPEGRDGDAPKKCAGSDECAEAPIP